MEGSTDQNHGAVPSATIAFIDLAGFSAIADVFGDRAAIAILEIFENLVEQNAGEGGRLIKWIGDEAMLAFPDPDAALISLGRLLPACRSDDRIPLTRSVLHHGPVIARGADLFGASVNTAARLSVLAKPGELLATTAVAEAASARGIETHALGPVALRSMRDKVPLFRIELAEAIDPAWIDPVCKMAAPFGAFQREKPAGPWFCSTKCKEVFRNSPETYLDQSE
jgi:adenylate cyclase